MVGRNEVAKLAGVAPSTVSNVINNTRFVSEDVRKKVLWAIKELGYEPNYVAKSLRSRRTRQIIVFISDLHNTYYADLCDGIIGTLTKQGYTVAVAVISDPSVDYYKEYYSRQVDGIINLSHIFCAEDLFQKFLDHKVAMVNCRSFDEVGSVSINYLGAVSEIVDKLIARGRKRIGFINGGTMESLGADSRYYGLKAYLEQKGRHFDGNLLINGNNRYSNMVEYGYESMKQLLQRASDLDGVFCINDMIAFGAWSYIDEIGKKVPEDISICGCDNIFFSDFVGRKLSTIAIDKVDFGVRCAKLLLAQLNGDSELASSMRQDVFAELIDRGSV